MKVLRRIFAVVATASVALIGTATVSASSSSRLTCSGTDTSPGIIAPGVYSSMTISGLCLIPGGTVTVRGDVTVDAGAALLANFPGSPGHPEGDAHVVVKGGILVGERGALMLGCSPGLGCVNTTSDTVDGSIVTHKALGVILHSDTIGGNLDLDGGGGGVNCAPQGVFALFKSPVYSTSEFDVIDGNVNVNNLRSCWFGEFNNIVMGNVWIAHNTFADPDATEIGSNDVLGNLACFHNIPAAQFGDNGPAPNTVAGNALGECTKLSTH